MNEFQKQAFAIATKCLIVVSVLVIGVVLTRLVLKLIKRVLFNSRLDHTASNFILSVLKIILYFIVAITALGTIGVNVASMITALGAAALTAGLALQDCLSNVVGGLVILINKPFVSGDLLEFENIKGRVETIRIFSTTIHTLDNKLVTVPNSRLTKNNIVNCTMVDKRRIDLKYTVSYDDNIDKVKSVINSVIQDSELILKDPVYEIYVGEHLENGIQILVYIWVEPDNYFKAYYYMQEYIKKKFDENGITIPYPHLVVKNDK